MLKIDLNSDLGENSPERLVADDAAMINLISSANISCGAHAGTPQGIKETLFAAKQRSVAVGAHPGFRDYVNFGRRELTLSDKELQADIEYQLGAFLTLAASINVPVRYVKPHGALYNMLAINPALARTVAAAIYAINPNFVVLGLAASPGLAVCERTGLTVAAEAFADRAYTPAGTLVPRNIPGAVLSNPETVTSQVLQLVQTGTVTAIDGSSIAVVADSVCVHGDSPAAVQLTAAIRECLTQQGIAISPFAIT